MLHEAKYCGILAMLTRRSSSCRWLCSCPHSLVTKQESFSSHHPIAYKRNVSKVPRRDVAIQNDVTDQYVT